MAFPPVQDPAYGLSAEALEYARQRYEETEDSQRSIAEDIGKSRGTLDRIAKAQGWKLRKDQAPRGLSEALKLRIAATEADDGKPSDAPKADVVASPDAAPADGSVAARLEAALERELRKVENLRADLGRPVQRTQQSDRIARTLATLTETLFRVRRLREPGNINGSNDDDLPADADGFRLALAQRIDVFVRSRTDGSVSKARQACGRRAGCIMTLQSSRTRIRSIARPATMAGRGAPGSILGGRGAGKTRLGAEWVRALVHGVAPWTRTAHTAASR
jgi:hypothetical protein